MSLLHRPSARIACLLCAVVTSAALAQTHKVTKTQTVVRAVGVYEWTGDLAKPNGSRLIPVSLYIDQKLQDAGVYQAQPMPFALETGNLYELQKAGVPQGTLSIAFTRKLAALPSDVASYDDGWFGYGKFRPPAAEKEEKSNLRTVTTVAKITGVDEDDDKPHFSGRSATPGSGGAATPLPGSAPTATTAPADDPDRPVMKRHADDASSTSDVPDDPDRPTLHKRASDTRAAASASMAAPLSNDPDRPILQRGKPQGSALSEADLPKLKGLPADTELQQMVAVSDAADRQQHDFSRPWSDDAERASILSTMQDAAHAALAAYEQANGLSPVNATVPAPSASRSASIKRNPPTAHKNSTKKTAPAPPAAPEPLLDEKLVSYSLSYGGSPTFVYSAHTSGIGAQERFVTIVAQQNLQGAAEVALKNVTDAAHLDRTPRLKLVDAVDAEASNRASLLFELRAQNSRQFALYRVIGGRATQAFITGSTR